MIFLLDTNAFSDLMSEVPRVKTNLRTHSTGNAVIICSVVRGEILYGIHRLPVGKKRQELQLKADNLFSIIPCEAIPALAADHYAAIKVASQKQGMNLNENDLWIAATGMAIGATVVTRDSDFQAVAGLPLVDWSV